MTYKPKITNFALIGVMAVSIGISIILLSVIFYPSFLPKIITNANSNWIQQSSYIFYILILVGFIANVFGIYYFSKFIKIKYGFTNDCLSKLYNSTTSLKSSKTEKIKSQYYPIVRIILSIINDRKYFRFFLPIVIGYGVIYSIFSGIIIIRPEGGLAHVSGIHNFPAIVMMQYGPIGYVPTMSIYISDNFGIFVIPLNLIIALAVSALVGLNSIISIYAFSNRYSNKNRFSFTNASTSPSSFLGALGATTSLFVICPTCASLYIFTAIAGGLAPSITAFTVTYYNLFIMVSIPLLLCAPIITALSIKKMNMNTNNTFDQCSLNKKKWYRIKKQ